MNSIIEKNENKVCTTMKSNSGRYNRFNVGKFFFFPAGNPCLVTSHFGGVW